jgi:hypothetical protein
VLRRRALQGSGLVVVVVFAPLFLYRHWITLEIFDDRKGAVGE